MCPIVTLGLFSLKHKLEIRLIYEFCYKMLKSAMISGSTIRQYRPVRTLRAGEGPLIQVAYHNVGQGPKVITLLYAQLN